MKQQLLDTLEQIAGKENIHPNEPMSRHTTFRVGGPADVLVTPEAEKLAAVTGACREAGAPYYIVGNGSNLLVGDGGIRGVVILTRDGMDEISADGVRITAGAGALLSRTASLAASHALTGMEFAAGIPGTIGGAVVMNAGAYGGEMRDIIETVTVLDDTGAQHVLSVEELELGYRTSIFARTGWCVLRATLQLHPGDSVQIQQKMDDLMNRRRQKQPLEYPSAGSAFKRPEGAFAGSLIEQCGLRGFRVGDAAISEKHCGFIVNLGHASCADVLELARQVSERVQRETGFVLEKEIRVVE